MPYCSVTISSDNLSGQTCNVTFLPASGGTISLGQQVFPFTYVSNYYWGTYQCYSPTYNYTYTIQVEENPTPTPTVSPGFTPTPTVTPTKTPVSPTPTPTLTKTPTPTPAVVYMENLWADGFSNIACGLADGANPANITIYSSIPWGSLAVGDFVYGNNGLTIPPSPVNGNIISDGAVWIQINSGTGQIQVLGICP